MTKLTDTQLVLLSAAANRGDGAIQIPEKLKGGAAQKVISGLIAKKLVKAVPRQGDMPLWRADSDGRPLALKITPVGLKAIGVDDAASACETATDPTGDTKRSSAAPRSTAKTKRSGQAASVSPPAAGKAQGDTKQARLIAMLSRKTGATAEEIGTTFGWQRHTVRGAIAGALKKKLGLAVISEKSSDGARVYRIAS